MGMPNVIFKPKLNFEMELEKLSGEAEEVCRVCRTSLRSFQQPVSRRESKCVWIKTSVDRWWKLKIEGIMLRLILETGDGGWWKRGKKPHPFITHISVLSTVCIATCSCETFGIPLSLSIDVYLILLIIIFYKVSMIVNLMFWGRANESWWHSFFSLKTTER